MWFSHVHSYPLPPAPPLSQERWPFAIKKNVVVFRTDRQQFIVSSFLLSWEMFAYNLEGYMKVTNSEKQLG